MSNEKLLSSLGLCAKAGKLIFGTDMICESLRGKNAPCLVLSACDNSENTEKKLQDKCKFYGVELYPSTVDGATLGHAVGKKSKLSAVAVTDKNLCRLVKESLEE